MVQTLKDDLISDLFVQYPPVRQTKRSWAFALEKAGFHLWADKKEIAGLLYISKGYVSSIWNELGGGNEPTQQERNDVIGRDQGVV